MATEVKDYVFEGTVNYLMRRPNDWGKYTVNFYPNDVKEVKSIGTRSKPNLDDDNKMFFRFYSTEPFKIVDPDGNDIEALVGNGSTVKIKLRTERFPSKEHGTVTRTKVVAIVVTGLIEYKRPETAVEEQAELPA